MYTFKRARSRRTRVRRFIRFSFLRLFFPFCFSIRRSAPILSCRSTRRPNFQREKKDSTTDDFFYYDGRTGRTRERFRDLFL